MDKNFWGIKKEQHFIASLWKDNSLKKFLIFFAVFLFSKSNGLFVTNLFFTSFN
ncbi:hypothetical protein P7G70_06975 [Enterococcus dispar]|nr:hypothetical protein [Enterococcus dispar]